jgi:hypothetical protein
MGMLIALQTLPFALFSLLAGVWLDRRSKHPVLLWSEFLFGCVLAVIPVCYWLGLLSMHVLYAVGWLSDGCRFRGRRQRGTGIRGATGWS